MARTKRLKVASTVRLDSGAGAFGNPRWMALLEQIERVRSISQAARAAGLSYKAAWDAVDAMNNLAGKPVVATAVGGKGGGGARLTARGAELLATYARAKQQNERFLAALNAELDGAGRDLRVLERLALRTSARNQWAGKVVRLRHGTVNDEVELKLAGGARIVAVTTHESVEHLGLAPGVEAIALVKASSVMLAVGAPGGLRLSARNQLHGTVSRLVRGAVNTEVVLALRGGVSVAAVVTNVAARRLNLAVGRPASAIFKASAVLLAAEGGAR